MNHEARGSINDSNWYIWITNYREYSYCRLAVGDLMEIIREEWNASFNGITVGRDAQGSGEMTVFFNCDRAYVACQYYETGEWWSSCDLESLNRSDWADLVRLTPDDTHDFSFMTCSIIPKYVAWNILHTYITRGDRICLYPLDRSGKPVLV